MSHWNCNCTYRRVAVKRLEVRMTSTISCVGYSHLNGYHAHSTQLLRYDNQKSRTSKHGSTLKSPTTHPLLTHDVWALSSSSLHLIIFVTCLLFLPSDYHPFSSARYPAAEETGSNPNDVSYIPVTWRWRVWNGNKYKILALFHSKYLFSWKSLNFKIPIMNHKWIGRLRCWEWLRWWLRR